MAKDPEQTRALLLEKAFEQIHLYGFKSTSISMILKDSGVTKGALYHHFKNKDEIGYAIVDEVVRSEIDQLWIQPLATTDDPVSVVIQTLSHFKENMSPEEMSRGCPLNNLIQEMSPIDPIFKEKLAKVVELWRTTLADAFRRGIQTGNVSKAVDPVAVAQFIIIIIEGFSSLAKNTQDISLLIQSMSEFFRYLGTLRS
jgi:TetR/AcrR family transcriptional regulator, transcriptional repressor for nem operon